MLGGNSLVLHIYPTEGITLSLQAKQPGPKLCIGEVQLKFDYGMLGKTAVDDAYERLLLDALLGDQTLFIDSAFIDEAWKLFTPVLEKWQSSDEKPEPYLCGSDGPLGAKKLIAPGLWRALDLE